MGIYLLAGAGIIFALIFALNNLVKTLLRRGQIGFLDLLLTFMTTLVLLAALIAGQPDALVSRAALLSGAALSLFSLLILLLEVFRAQRLKGSRGLLGMYSGLLLMLASFGVPIIGSQFERQTQAASAPTSIAFALTEPVIPTDSFVVTDMDTPEQTEALDSTDTSAPTEAAHNAATPISTPTPSLTLFVYSTRTPTPIPTLPTPCVASVQYNLRLRSAPNTSSDTLATIPYSTSIELYGKGTISATAVPGGQESRWWYTTYQSEQGWVDGQYLLVSSACDDLPVKDVP
ncbi:MAG TPA: SH3 domain-containing protein [Phototrophicaceae bacterium]|nr:SH3 domain-containing protein [Phototrophicaceae bacterium]